MEIATAIGNVLDEIEARNQFRFRESHRRPGLMFWRQCQDPQVTPRDEKVKDGIRVRTDVCHTCQATHTALERVVHT